VAAFLLKLTGLQANIHAASRACFERFSNVASEGKARQKVAKNWNVCSIT